MKIKAEIKIVTAKIRLAVTAALEGTGYNLDKSNATYGSNDLNMTFRMSEPTVDGLSKAQHEFEIQASMYGLEASDFGRTVPLQNGKNNKMFRIVGLNSRAPKNCIMIEDKNGKGFRCSLDVIKRGLAKANAVSPKSQGK